MDCVQPFLAGIAKYCAPSQVVGMDDDDVPEGMLAIVANNPSKDALQHFVEKNSDKIRVSFHEFLTGTGTTGKMVSGVTGADMGMKTKSGPIGGDAQLGGLLAMDAALGTHYVSGVIFFNDESEPHQLDIYALKALSIAILGHAKSGGLFAENAGEGKNVLRALGTGRR